MRVTRVLPGLLVVGVLAAACGSSSDEGATATVDSNVRSAVDKQSGGSATTAGSSVTTAAARSIDELEAQWSAQRETVVQRIESEGFGLQPDGKTVLGADGFTIDIAACPAGWSNTEGLTDTEIKVGWAFPYSGTVADGGNIGRGFEAVFAYVNDKFGGIEDLEGKTRKIVGVARDDGYDPARTIPLVDELIDSEKVFAVTTQGSANTMRVYDKLNQRCVPQPLSVTGHPAWGDPVNHPWTTSILLGYNTEAILWGSYIERTLPPGVTVAGLAMNNDFGKAYVGGMKAFMAQSDHDISLEVEYIEPSAATVTNEMTNLSAKNPDVFIVMSTGVACTQAATDAANIGLNTTAKQLWMPSVCRALSFVGRDKAGDAVKDWLIAGGGVIDINDLTVQDRPAVKWARKVLADQGLDSQSSSNLGTGVNFGLTYVELLRIAAALPGGLNRTNLVTAMRHIDYVNPLYLDGVRLTMDGNADAYMSEASEFGRFSIDKQSWVPEGAVINLNGQTANCAWNQATATCG